MTQRAKGPSRKRRSDPFEAVKPLIVLGLLGMIIYGAYSVIRRGPSAGPSSIDLAPPAVGLGNEPQPAGPAPPAAAAVSAAAPPEAVYGQAAAVPQASPSPLVLKAVPASPPEVVGPTSPPSASSPPPTAAVASPSAVQGSAAPTEAPTGADPNAPGQAGPRERSAAFATAWADAHEKLAAARYAEALRVLSQWYDDPGLGPEESHRLEEILGQLAGTVIYSQQDHLLPPHIVAAGENLRDIAAGLAVPWQVLAKINGVDAPARLVPGEPLKVVMGPFDASLSLSRRRISLQLHGNYAGSFPVVIGRQVHDQVGATLAVAKVRRGGRGPAQAAADVVEQAAGVAAQPQSKQILLAGGILIEAADDPTVVAETVAGPSLIVSARDLDELIDILGDGSRVFVRP